MFSVRRLRELDPFQHSRTSVFFVLIIKPGDVNERPSLEALQLSVT